MNILRLSLTKKEISGANCESPGFEPRQPANSKADLKFARDKFVFHLKK